MDKTERLLSREEIFQGKVMHVVRDRVSLPDGGNSIREVALHNGAVAVLPLDDEGNVYMVKQYRYAVGMEMEEIPAGKLDSPEEDPVSAARRELSEETGLVADRLSYLGEYYGSPAILREKIHLFLAEGLHQGDAHPDADEFLSVYKVPLKTLTERVLAGEVPDGKTQCAVLRAAMLRKTTEENA